MDEARGAVARFAKAPAGILAIIKEDQKGSAKSGGRPAASVLAEAGSATVPLW